MKTRNIASIPRQTQIGVVKQRPKQQHRVKREIEVIGMSAATISGVRASAEISTSPG